MVKSPNGNMAESAIALFFFFLRAGQVGIIISAKGSLNVQLSHGSGIASPAGPGTQPAGHAGLVVSVSKSQPAAQVPGGSVSGTHLQPGAQIFESDAFFTPEGEEGSLSAQDSFLKQRVEVVRVWVTVVLVTKKNLPLLNKEM